MNTVALLLALTGGIIHWTHTPNIETGPQGAVVPVLELLQEGDETAREVRAEFEFLGQTLVAPTLVLAPRGGAFRLAPEGAFPSPERGVHLVRYRLRWADGNGYPFSAVLVALHRVPDSGPVNPDPAVLPATLHFTSEGEATTKISNRSGERMVLHANLLLPDEFRGRFEPETLTIPPGEEADAAFSIEAVGAIPGSHYNAYLLVEGVTERGSPVAGFGRMELFVDSPEAIGARWRPVLGLVLSFATIGLVVGILRRRSSGGVPPSTT